MWCGYRSVDGIMSWNNQCREAGTECMAAFIDGLEGEAALGGALGIFTCATVEILEAGLS